MTDIRRVVAGTDAAGRPAVLFDATAQAVVELPAVPGTTLVDLWRSSSVPLDPTTDDPTRGDFELMPAGALFRVIDLAPTGDADPMWHETSSVDFIYIASGRAGFLHEGGRVDLGAGDAIVVQAIRHAWVNDGPEMARLVNASVATR